MQTNTNQKNGHTFSSYIDCLDSPKQLTHRGFYQIAKCSVAVNDELVDSIFSEYNKGDFYALAFGGAAFFSEANGCRYGNLIVSSPRIQTGIWIGNIWDYQFASWIKLTNK